MIQCSISSNETKNEAIVGSTTGGNIEIAGSEILGANGQEAGGNAKTSSDNSESGTSGTVGETNSGSKSGGKGSKSNSVSLTSVALNGQGLTSTRPQQLTPVILSQAPLEQLT